MGLAMLSLSTCMGRLMGLVYCGLSLGTWNVTSLVRKEPEALCMGILLFYWGTHVGIKNSNMGIDR